MMLEIRGLGVGLELLFRGLLLEGVQQVTIKVTVELLLGLLPRRLAIHSPKSGLVRGEQRRGQQQPLGRETRRFAVRVLVWAAIAKDTLVYFIVPNLTNIEVSHERRVLHQ